MGTLHLARSQIPDPRRRAGVSKTHVAESPLKIYLALSAKVNYSGLERMHKGESHTHTKGNTERCLGMLGTSRLPRRDAGVLGKRNQG